MPFVAWLLLFVIGSLKLAFLATAFENSTARIDRLQFALCLLGVIVGLPVLAFVSQFLTEAVESFLSYRHRYSAGVSLVVCTLLVWAFQLALVRRARDAGRGKGLCYLAIFPLINVPIWIYFVLAPSAPR